MNKIFKPVTSLISVTLLSALLASCGGGGDKAAGHDKAAANSGKKTIGVTISTQNNPWFVTMKERLISYGKEKNVNVIVLDDQNDSAKELGNVEDLISKKVDILLINCIESQSCTSAVREADAQHIPVITIDRTASSNKVKSYVAADNIKGAREAGQYMAKLLHNKGDIAQLEGTPGATPTIERGEGFAKGIEGTDIHIVASITANFDRAKGMSVMEDILQSHPNIVAVFAQNDEMAAGAIQAIKAAGKEGKIKVIGFDAEPIMLKFINEGAAQASVMQDSGLIAEYSIDAALKVMDGKGVASKTSVPTVLITKDNVGKYLK